jgi:hypothetical protein
MAFPSRAAFAEPTLDARAATVPFVSQARLNGCIVLSNWERGEVEKLLPCDLALGTNTSPTPDLHPVAFVFGGLSDGATIFGGVTFFTGIAYQEFAMAIPFVKHRRGAHLHTYIPRMYSSYFPPTWSGNTYYGFAKEIARLGWQGPIFVITSDGERLLLHASVESAGGWVQGDACDLEDFVEMREMFALPILGRKANGSYVGSHFGWDFADALVRPASACISIDAPLVACLTPRRWHAVGAFEVHGMLWRLSWPFPCEFR